MDTRNILTLEDRRRNQERQTANPSSWTYPSELPDTIEDLTQFVLISKAKLQEYVSMAQSYERLKKTSTHKTPWIRTTELAKYYGINKTKAFDLIREFKAQTDPSNWIKDGRVTIVRQEEFEKWWRSRK